MKISRFIKTIVFAALILFKYQISFGQENYLPGKLITINGDTLNGFIDYRNWAKNPNKIFFKSSLNENIIIQTPLDIRGFTVLDEVYESAIIKTDFSLSDLGSIREFLIGIDNRL